MAKADKLKSGLGNLLQRTDQEPDTTPVVEQALTPEEERRENLIDQIGDEELRTALRAKRFAGGRPRKGTSHTSKEDGYGRVCIVANTEKMDKIREMAFRETLTIKEVMEAAMDLAIQTYEKKHGKLNPNPDNWKGGDVSKLFN